MRDRNQSRAERLLVVLAKERRARQSAAHDRIRNPLASGYSPRGEEGEQGLLSGQEVAGRETAGSCLLLHIVLAR